MTAPAGGPQAPVLVAVDGSAASDAAVALGVREARLRQRPLRLVHAFEWPLLGVYLGPSPEGPGDGGLAADADRVVTDALALAAASDRGYPGQPRLVTTGEVITGPVVPVLLAEATHAALLVLGHRGMGGFTGLLVGSVAVQLASYAPVPVLVARGEPAPDAPVVVGVDGSRGATHAVEFGFTEAAARGVELIAITGWSGRLSRRTEDELPLVYDLSDIERVHAGQLAEALAGCRARWPELVVHERVVRGRPGHLLVAASRTAQLVVVGARGRGGFGGLVLGSISQAVLHHAACPVAVVRAPTPDPR